MTKKRPTSKQIAESLNATHFGESSALTPSDPVVPTTLLCKLPEIKPYDHNPRWAPNERYEEIKASIRSRGLETTLPISRRPGDEFYMVSKGGNTRLRILNELNQETDDDRFFEVRCDFTPWVSESNTLLAHLTENDKRGSLLFIDRARGVRELKAVLERESGETLALRQFSDRLQQLGYVQDAGTITRMNYALDVLLPAIPVALAAGMGRRQIDAMRRLHDAAAEVWQDLAIEDDFEPIFAELLKRHDREQWDYLKFRTAIEKEIEVTTERDPINVAEALNRILGSDSKAAGAGVTSAGDSPSNTAVSLLPLPLKRQLSPPEVAHNNGGGPENSGKANVRNADGETTKPSKLKSHSNRKPNHTGSGPSFSIGNGDDADAKLNEPQTAVREDLKSLRAASFTLATGLAQRNGLEGAVSPLANGVGYLVIDCPRAKSQHKQSHDDYRIAVALWWHLAACAGIASAPAETVLSLLPRKSSMAVAIRQGPVDTSNKHLPSIDTALIGDILWPILDDRDWTDLIQLMDNFRRIRRIAAAGNVSLWDMWDI